MVYRMQSQLFEKSKSSKYTEWSIVEFAFIVLCVMYGYAWGMAQSNTWLLIESYSKRLLPAPI